MAVDRSAVHHLPDLTLTVQPHSPVRHPPPLPPPIADSPLSRLLLQPQHPLCPLATSPPPVARTAPAASPIATATAAAAAGVPTWRSAWGGAMPPSPPHLPPPLSRGRPRAGVPAGSRTTESRWGTGTGSLGRRWGWFPTAHPSSRRRRRPPPHRPSAPTLGMGARPLTRCRPRHTPWDCPRMWRRPRRWGPAGPLK